MIVMQRLIKVDGKVRTDMFFPAGFMDVVQIKKIMRGPKATPYAVTHDGRTLRYPDPDIKPNDTIRLDINDGKIIDHVKFEAGNIVMISGGKNMGRVGVIVSRERHPGSFEIIHIKDAVGHTFATRLSNVFVIGQGSKP